MANNRNFSPKGMVGNLFLAGEIPNVFMPERVQNTTKKIRQKQDIGCML
ncbi:hypothetical protein [Xenorhabdus bovienii]|nr:hypothetical protein [Xenorhabdus bovienii]